MVFGISPQGVDIFDLLGTLVAHSIKVELRRGAKHRTMTENDWVLSEYVCRSLLCLILKEWEGMCQFQNRGEDKRAVVHLTLRCHNSRLVCPFHERKSDMESQRSGQHHAT